jgi:hypothetical protein
VCACVRAPARETLDGVWVGELDLLTTYIHYSELQIIIVLLLISWLRHYATSWKVVGSNPDVLGFFN